MGKAPQKFTDLLSGKLSAKLPAKLAERAERGPVVAVVKLHGVITATPSPVSRPTISTQIVESASPQLVPLLTPCKHPSTN